MRFRAYRSTIIAANWKAVVDAFNESYHVQGLHEQILPWTDDVSIEYEQFERHAHYGRLPGARRELRPSPRLGLRADEYDEGEILGALVAGLGGAFLGEERAAVEELRASGPPPGSTLLGAYQERRMTLLAERGFDVSGFTPDLMTSADDVFWFPNLVGPIYPGQRDPVPGAAQRARSRLARSRTRGCSSGRGPAKTWQMPERRFYADWHERNWGEITEQDYANLANVQRGMRSRGFDGSRLASKQESNVLHMHRVVDRYLTQRSRADARRDPSRCSRLRSAKRARSLADVVGVEAPVARGRDRVATTPRRRTPSARCCSTRLSTFCVAVDGKPVRDADEARHPLGREVRLRGEERDEPVGVERGAVVQVQRDHHLVADLGRRHGVDRGEHDVGVPRDHLLDRRGREVLAVDPQPVGVAPGEVEEAGVVAVAEVAGPVHAVAHALGVRPRGCCSSPRSCRAPSGFTISPIASSALSRRPCSSNCARRRTPRRCRDRGSRREIRGSGMPSEPGGVSSVFDMLMPPSVEP